MLYRRKLVLALLEAWGGGLLETCLQPVLFLLAQRQEKPAYDFVPCTGGPFSFTAATDLEAMTRLGQVHIEEGRIEKLDTIDYRSGLPDKDRLQVEAVHNLFGDYSLEAFIKYCAIVYPYYAINSTEAMALLNAEERKAVQDERSLEDSTVLFTIGYEGRSLEAYLNCLIRNGVQVLVDVRNNPFSQKFGFAGILLQRFCQKVGIDYVHMGELGIPSAYRKERDGPNFYEKLFDKYKKETLTTTLSSQEKLLALLRQMRRIALTCFEADEHQCHRKSLGEAIEKLPGWNFELKHI